MTPTRIATSNDGWLEASGLPHLFRILGLAVHPAKLGIGLAAIVLTLLYGGLLDWVWSPADGVPADAIERYILARDTRIPYVEGDGELGIFHVWREHEGRSLQGLLWSSLPGASVASGTPLGSYVEAQSRYQPLRNLVGLFDGVLWLLREHFFFFLIFSLGALAIWALAGGAICRIAAVQFARDEKLTMQQGVRFVRERFLGGFFLAPCIPLALAALIALMLILGGLLLRLPILGDLIAGAAFFLALIGGFIVALLLIGLAVGGSLFWPAAATEASDAFDSFSRGLSYPLTKPWKAIWYAVVALVFAAVCWLFVNLITFFGLSVTRTVVGFGTAPFGWLKRGTDGATVNKLELLWPMRGPEALYDWPVWSMVEWYEVPSALFIGLYVMIVVGLMWSFLASFYFSGSTVIYILLRRDVDGTDIEEVFLEEEHPDPQQGFQPQPASNAPATPLTIQP